MQNSDCENVLSDVPIETAKPKQVRTKRAIWRYSDDGTYDKKPLAETYDKTYYLEHVKHVYIECPYCKTSINKPHYARHISTTKMFENLEF